MIAGIVGFIIGGMFGIMIMVILMGGNDGE